MLPKHKLPKVCIDNLRITAKIVCFSQSFERQDTQTISEALYLKTSPIETNTLNELLTEACKFMAEKREKGGRVVIVTTEYDKLGTTLAMAYLVKHERKTLKEAWTVVRTMYIALRQRWEHLEHLALFEQNVKNTEHPTVVNDEEFL
nr:serine:threonine:tyrosine interacting [Hymenolepis microstoma]